MDDLVDEILNFMGENVSEEEKEILLSLSVLVDEYSQAILDGDKLKQKTIATKYKKAYKYYQLQMVDKEELSSLSPAQRKDFEDQIDEDADMMLHLTEMIVNNEIDDDDLAEILGEFVD